ncbi:Putative regulatory protein FmdB [Patulibacter medicamentivorans]|jgi:putative FmdB family regulatory protein|uniref:Putative regulatory protein FmdB n=1 Tax=Patulibacter medicamentivorans TaxID=1097667 RepID=H0E469_9ACTN|nr:FmdB family zinc ribbon protein [Patulibacter medicamentivorans]EHN11536.1 Putative regulatory protein FmdB [Patulibacter medicamentivorans]
MPVYEYRRPDGTTFEVLQKFTDDALTHDPETGEPVQRVLHAPAIHFKGKGFYANDVGTVRGNRELERAAEAGADAHDAKMHAQRREREKAKADSDRRKAQQAQARAAAKVRGDSPKQHPKQP